MTYKSAMDDPDRIQRTDTRHRHQPAADCVFTNDGEHSLVQLFVFHLKGRPGGDSDVGTRPKVNATTGG